MDLRIIHGAASCAAGIAAFALLQDAGTTGALINALLWGVAVYAVAEAVIVMKGYRERQQTPEAEAEAQVEPDDAAAPVVPESELALPKKWVAFKETVAKAIKKVDGDESIDVKASATAFLGIVKEYERLTGMYGDIIPEEEQDGMLSVIKEYTAKIAAANAAAEAVPGD
jgi:hypothetical protein